MNIKMHGTNVKILNDVATKYIEGIKEDVN